MPGRIGQNPPGIRFVRQNKFLKKVLAFSIVLYYNNLRCKRIGVSPNGKATDSDSVISRFESLYPSLRVSVEILEPFFFFLSKIKGFQTSDTSVSSKKSHSDRMGNQ